jgi:hypothetical protein
LAIRASRSTPSPSGPPCLATASGQTYGLDAQQGANATTIAAVGQREGLPDHAVTVALAAALQESKLHNLTHGDLDSLGLFQQRPSQGWGTPAEILSPAYAATAFYRHLTNVPGWQTLTVTAAAQAVQLSAAPDAYAAWEPMARVVAQALTGEVPAGFTCRAKVNVATDVAARAAAMATELGNPDLGVTVTAAHGWLVASWLIGHAGQFGVASVTFAGSRWSARSGVWAPRPPPVLAVNINTN